MYPSSSSFEFIFLVVFPPYPTKYPPKIFLVGFFDRPMYKMSEVGFPESELSIITNTVPLLYGRLEKESSFKGRNSGKPFSLRVKEFIFVNVSGTNLTLPI